MDEKFVVVIAKSSKEHQVQCRSCGAKSPITSEAEVEEWCKDHKCGKEAVEKKAEEAPPADPPKDPEPTGDENPPADPGESDSEDPEEEDEG